MQKFFTKDGYRLRAPEPEDLACMKDFENNTSLWEVTDITGPYSSYYLKRYITENKNDIYTDRQLRLMVESPDGDVVGIADFFHFDPFHSRVEVGIVVAEAHRRKGIASLALGMMADYAFGYLGVHQLYAHTLSDNVAACRLFEHCGFVRTALLTQWVRSGSLYKDVCVMQLFHPDMR